MSTLSADLSNLLHSQTVTSNMFGIIVVVLLLVLWFVGMKVVNEAKQTNKLLMNLLAKPEGMCGAGVNECDSRGISPFEGGLRQ